MTSSPQPHGLAPQQTWQSTVGPLETRLIKRMGTGHMSGREDLWYWPMRPDGSTGALRSCFVDTWIAWQRKTQAVQITASVR